MFISMKKLWSCCLGFSGMLSTCFGMQPTIQDCLEENAGGYYFDDSLAQNVPNNSPVESPEENTGGISMSRSFATINFADMIPNEEDADESELRLSSVKSLPTMNRILGSGMMRPVAKSVPAELEIMARGWNESHNSIWVGNFRIGNWSQVSTDMWNWLAFFYPGLTAQNLNLSCYDDTLYRKKFFSYSEELDEISQRGFTIILQRKWLYDNDGSEVCIENLGNYLRDSNCNPVLGGLKDYLYDSVNKREESRLFYYTTTACTFPGGKRGEPIDERRLGLWLEHHMWTLSARIFCCKGFSVLTHISLNNRGMVLVEDLPQLYSFAAGSNDFCPPDIFSRLGKYKERYESLRNVLPKYSPLTDYSL